MYSFLQRRVCSRQLHPLKWMDLNVSKRRNHRDCERDHFSTSSPKLILLLLLFSRFVLLFLFCFFTSFSSSASPAFVYTKTLHDCCWISPEDQREKPLLLSSSKSNAPPTLLALFLLPFFLPQKGFS